MTQSLPPGGNRALKTPNLQLQGGAAIVAPPTAFPSGVPGNALVVVPLSKPTDELKAAMEKGPVAVDLQEMWKLLGFNGPAVQVQDADGRPIAIGLEDLLEGLNKHWQENKDDLARGRLYAQELMKYGRFEQAEKVLAFIVARGGTGEDWLGLGVAQLQREEWDKAVGTLRGAQNLLAKNPFPSLHLAKALKGKGETEAEREAVERAISIDPNAVDAWAYLFAHLREHEGEEKALARVDELAQAETNKATAAPYVALQGVLAADENKRDEAIKWAKKAVERNPKDTLALVSLSALYGQKGDLDSVIALLQPAEDRMASDVRLANNYFEALFQKRDIEKVTKLLNALAGSANREVKQFATERSRAVAQFLQRQQQQLAKAQQNPTS